MKKNKGSLTGFGIALLVILGLVMIIHVYIKTPDEPFYMRLLSGILYFGSTIICSGVVFLAFFAVFYAAIHASGFIFSQEESDDEGMESFMKLGNPIVLISYIITYVIVFLAF